MDEITDTAKKNIPTKHDVPKCISCGNIGKLKTQPIFTPLYVIMGLLLILVWAVPKPTNFISVDWIDSSATPWILQLLFGTVWLLLMRIPPLKSWVINAISIFSGLISGSSRWIIGLILGFVYFIGIFIVRCNRNKREKVCENCKAINRFTFIY